MLTLSCIQIIAGVVAVHRRAGGALTIPCHCTAALTIPYHCTTVSQVRVPSMDVVVHDAQGQPLVSQRIRINATQNRQGSTLYNIPPLF